MESRGLLVEYVSQERKSNREKVWRGMEGLCVFLLPVQPKSCPTVFSELNTT